MTDEFWIALLVFGGPLASVFFMEILKLIGNMIYEWWLDKCMEAEEIEKEKQILREEIERIEEGR